MKKKQTLMNKRLAVLLSIGISFLGAMAAEAVTLQATLEADTFCVSSAPDAKYASTATSLTELPYFGIARDHANVSRFGMFQWRLPVVPANMRVANVRVKFYAREGAAVGSGGTIGLAALKANPALSTVSWNTSVAGGYIEGRDSEDYTVLVGSNAVALAETMNGADQAWKWQTKESSVGVVNSLAQKVREVISPSVSNKLTLMTLPLTGNGATEWRGGSQETDFPAILEVDFVDANVTSVPVTNDLLISLEGSSANTNSTNTVAIWSDNSLFGGWQDFNQPVAARRPTLIITNMPNGKIMPVLEFNASQLNYLELGETAELATNTLTWFVVFKADLDGDNATRSILCSAGSMDTASGPVVRNYYWGTFIDGDGSDFRVFANDAGQTMIQPSYTPTVSNQWFVMSGTWNGTPESCNGNNAETLTLRLLAEDRVNNTEIVETNVNSVATGHIMTRIARLSNIDDTSRLFDGQIAEVLIYNTALSPADAETVTEYLNLKYFKLRGTLIKVN